MLNFEDIYEEIKHCVSINIYHFRNRLKTDKEDLEQELLITVFNCLDKIEKVKQDNGNWQGYVYGICCNELKNIELKEHKQGLWMTGAYEDYMTGTSSAFEVEDHFLEWYKAYKNEHAKKYYQKNKEKVLEYSKKYRKENLDKIKKYATLYSKKYYQENKEKIKIKVREWELNNKDRAKENRKIWEEKNKEHLKEYRKQYNEEHKEHLKEYYKQWFQEHKEEQKEKRKEYIQEYSKQYYQKNKEKIKEYQRQRRQQLKEQQLEDAE